MSQGQARQNGAYVSRLVNGDPEGAAWALDAVYRGLPVLGGGRFVQLKDGLWLDCHGLVAEPDAQVVRAACGLLWFGCWPLRVRIELLEWSSIACELAIRPRSYRWPARSERYARRAADDLECLADLLEAAGAAGHSRGRAGAQAPFVLINSWSTAGNSPAVSGPRHRQSEDWAVRR